MDRLPTNMAIITNGQSTLARFPTHVLEQWVSLMLCQSDISEIHHRLSPPPNSTSSFFPSSVQEEPSLLVSVPPRTFQMRLWISSEPIPSCFIQFILSTAAPWWWEQAWTTATLPWWWIKWMLWTDATRCSFLAQVRQLQGWRWTEAELLQLKEYFEQNFYIKFVLLIDRGTVQKVIVLPKDPTSMEELTLEEVEVFRVCVNMWPRNDSTALIWR